MLMTCYSTSVTITTLPTTTVTTVLTTDVSYVDEPSVDATETEWISETSTVYEEVTTSTTTVYAIQTVEAGAVNVVRDADIDERGVTEVQPEQLYPAYASTCGSFEKYSSACKCIGSRPQTTTAETPIVTSISTEYTTVVSTELVTESATSTNYVPVTESVEATTYFTTETIYERTATTTVTEYTATVTNIVRNGGFETGNFRRWTGSRDNQVNSYVVRPGNRGTNFALETENMVNNNLLEIYQDITGAQGTRYECTYDWKFTDYYATYYAGERKTYIPYVHVYINNEYIDWVSPDNLSKGTWQTSTFEFTSGGTDRLWFDCASPQPKRGAGSGTNYLSLDNIACFAK